MDTDFINALNVLKIFGLSALAFIVAMLSTPMLTNWLYKKKMWPKESRLVAITGEEASVVKELRKDKPKNVPRIGGILIWGTMLIIIFIFWLLSYIYPSSIFLKLNFLSRGQTWLPLFTLISAALIGLLDDLLHIKAGGRNIKPKKGKKCAHNNC